jgi:hypothetical protein
MDFTRILELLLYALPALITGAVTYYFFKTHTENEENRRQHLLKKDLQKESLPLRLQAYERLSLFLERISPNKLLLRVKPTSIDKDAYEALLVQSIQQEMEHNLTQQIYVSENCWNVISTAKSATIQLIRKANLSEKTDTADKLREVILTDMMDKHAPSDTALSILKEEVRELWY